MGVYSDVPCTEEFGTANEDYDQETGLLSAEVTLRCAYEDRHELARDIVANRREWPKGGFGLVPRAARAGIRMSGDAGLVDGQAISSLTSLVTVYYSTKNEDIITEEIEPTSEFVTLDHRQFRWGSGVGERLLEDEAPGYLIRGINFVRTEMYVQPPIPQAFLTLIGTVNNATITSDLLNGLSFASETLLFSPPTITRKLNALGQQQYDMVKKWSYKPQGWNVFFRQKTGLWTKIYLAGSDEEYNSYPLANHSVLRTTSG